MSSHREAPAISKDPVADNTDLYAFVDPADTSKVTLLANFIPLEEPAGGPNFFQFGDEVLYEILIDNDGDGEEDVVYQFRFKTVVQNPGTFLYNTGPISSLTDPNWNVRQSYTVNRIQGDRDEGDRRVLGSDLPTPPVRIGPRSTPDYASLASAAVQDLGNGVKTFAGQRGEGFYVDWTEHENRLYLRVWEFGGPEPEWSKVFAEVPLADVDELMRRAGFDG